METGGFTTGRGQSLEGLFRVSLGFRDPGSCLDDGRLAIEPDCRRSIGLAPSDRGSGGAQVPRYSSTDAMTDLAMDEK